MDKRVKFVVNADGTHQAAINEKTSNRWTNFWKAMEVEKKSSPVVSTIQVEVAEAMEAFRIDSSQ